jgi:hypothetical protein
MKRKPRKEKRNSAKSILRLPDLEATNSAVLNNLLCPDAKRGYLHAIDEFVEWYCLEPRLFKMVNSGKMTYRVILRTEACEYKEPVRCDGGESS